MALTNATITPTTILAAGTRVYVPTSHDDLHVRVRQLDKVVHLLPHAKVRTDEEMLSEPLFYEDALIDTKTYRRAAEAALRTNPTHTMAFPPTAADNGVNMLPVLDFVTNIPMPMCSQKNALTITHLEDANSTITVTIYDTGVTRDDGDTIYAVIAQDNNGEHIKFVMQLLDFNCLLGELSLLMGSTPKANRLIQTLSEKI